MPTIALTSSSDEPELGMYYRYDEIRYAAPLNEYDEPVGSGSLKIHVTEFPILKLTPKGAWVDVYGDRKFVLSSANKRFACATLEEAQASYAHRKRKQIAILRSRMKSAEEALVLFTQQFPVLLQSLRDGCELMTLEQYREMDNAGTMADRLGMGYYATADAQSDLRAGWVSRPVWATHVAWYKDNSPPKFAG